VLLSGGASSLAAAPEGAIKPDELLTLYTLLLSSGLDITAMNIVRKRFSRWGAGRLAVALHPARVRNFIVSDVIGDDLSAIGSGPCVPDDTTAAVVHSLLADAGLWERIPLSMRRYVMAVERDPSLETPKPGHPAFRHLEKRVIASNRLALDAAPLRSRVRSGHRALSTDRVQGGDRPPRERVSTAG
jgi:hydroxypyruvate reductase